MQDPVKFNFRIIIMITHILIFYMSTFIFGCSFNNAIRKDEVSIYLI